MSKIHKVSQEVREQIIGRIKNDGISVKQAAEEHGVTDRAVYNWLGAGVSGQPTILEYNKLKKENHALKAMLGEATMSLAQAQKKF